MDVNLPAAARELIDRFASHRATVGVVGLGYVGLPLAVVMAEAGYQVIGVDLDPEKVAALRESLSRSLRTHFENEIQRSLQNINNAIAPYTRFVRSERNKMTDMQNGLDIIKQELDRVRVKIEEL